MEKILLLVFIFSCNNRSNNAVDTVVFENKHVFDWIRTFKDKVCIRDTIYCGTYPSNNVGIYPDFSKHSDSFRILYPHTEDHKKLKSYYFLTIKKQIKCGMNQLNCLQGQQMEHIL